MANPHWYLYIKTLRSLFSKKSIPNSFFAYDQHYLSPHILNANSSLANETVNLISKGGNNQQVRRPYFICNTSMFVQVPNQVQRTLVPLQITPFFTGVLASPPNAFDANQQPVGGGGITSFAFSSNLEKIDLQTAYCTQDRQFGLIDAAGLSSSFFAEYLATQGTVQSDNPKQFLAEAKNHLSVDTTWQPLLEELPKNSATLLRHLLNKLQQVLHRDADPEDTALSQHGIDPGLFKKAFNKLAGIVPRYQYWSVNATPVATPIQVTEFADGGNLENTGIAALLTYQDIDNIIGFVIARHL